MSIEDMGNGVHPKETPKEEKMEKEETKPMSPEEAKRLSEEEKETLETLKNFVNELIKEGHEHEKNKISVPLGGNERVPVSKEFIKPRVIKELIAAFSADWDIEEKGSYRGKWLELSAKETE